MAQVPTSNDWRCLYAPLGSVTDVLGCDEVTTSGDVTIADPTPDYPESVASIQLQSDDGVPAELEIELPVGQKFTCQLEFDLRAVPATLGDLQNNRIFIGMYNTSGKCAGIVLSQEGVSVVDTPGTSAEVFPDTSYFADLNTYYKLRLVVDAGGMLTIWIEHDSSAWVLLTTIAPDTPEGFSNGLIIDVVGQVATPTILNVLGLYADCYRALVLVEPPIAVIGPDQSVSLGTVIPCDATGSVISAAVTDGYFWSLVLAPDGSRFKIAGYGGHPVDNGSGTGQTSIFSCRDGEAAFSAENAPLLKPGDTLIIYRDGATYAYTVSDMRWMMGADGWVRDLAHGWDDDEIVLWRPVPLSVWDVRPPETHSENVIPLSWDLLNWEVCHSATFFHNPTAEQTYAVPDVQGLYEIQLILWNSTYLYSSPVTMLVNVTTTMVALGVVPDVSFIWSYLSNFWDLLEDKEKVATIWSGFAQAAANILLTAWQIDYNKSLKDIQPTFQRKWLPYVPVLEDSSESIRVRRGPLYSIASGTGPWLVGGMSMNLIVDGGPVVRVTFTDGGGVGLSTAEVVRQINLALQSAGYPLLASGYSPLGQTYQLPQLVHPDGGLIQVLPDEEAGSQGLAQVVLGWYRKTLLDEEPATYYAQNEVYGAASVEWEYDTFHQRYYPGKLWFGGDGKIYPPIVESDYTTGDLFTFATCGIEEPFYTPDFDQDGFWFAATFAGFGPALDVSLSEKHYILQQGDALPLASEGQYQFPSLVVSDAVDFSEAGVVKDDLARFSVTDIATGVAVDIYCSVQGVYGKQLGFDPRPLLIKWNGNRAGFSTVFTGVKRTQYLRVDDLVVSVPRLQADIKDPVDILEEGKHYDVKEIDPYTSAILPVSGAAKIKAIVFRPGTFTPLDPPADKYWAEDTHLDNGPAIDANFGSMVPPLSSKSYKEWQEELPNLNYLAAVQGLWYAYWGGPSVYRMRVGAQILLGLPFAEEEGVVVEVNDQFSAKEGRLLIQDKNGGLVRSYFYPRAVGPTSFRVGDSVEKFAPLCGGVEILDWVSSPNWGGAYVSNNTISSLQKYFTFMLRGNVDAFDPLHIMFAVEFIKNIKPHYTKVLTVLQKVIQMEVIDVVSVVKSKIKMKIVQSTDPQVRGALRWDDFDGAGNIRHWFDEDPIQFIWDHDGLSPRMQIGVISSAFDTGAQNLAQFQAAGAVDEYTTTLWTMPSSGTLVQVIVVVDTPLAGTGFTGATLAIQKAGGVEGSICTVNLMNSAGTYMGAFVAPALACDSSGVTGTFNVTGGVFGNTTAGEVTIYFVVEP